ncbi:MAG: ABC transporter ATP-binding protein [Candidatus Roseilinea sp.]|nr:MAG: ABC transporter ATP-binding protein [Candidatus Roseilinea sp.]
MADIELQQVEKRFGEQYAVRPLDLCIKNGEFVALLGPSGCGKTTTLRMIAGLETVSGGRIILNGQDVTWLKPSQRDVAMVFQFFALYPHLTAWENIAFPLQAEGERRENIQRRVKEVAELLQIEPLLKSRPGALSSGDQQRIALARALVRRPSCFLMDEPLGALDADFRETMRSEIKRLHILQNATTVYVTHDQIEAMAMADRIVVMSQGVVQQVGTPAEVYHTPSNLFVAQFIGSPGMNLVKGDWADGVATLPGGNRYTPPPGWPEALNRGLSGSGVIVGFRPEAVHIHPSGQLAATVYSVDLHGAYTMLVLEMGDDHSIHARVSRDAHFTVGETIRFDLNPSMVRFFDPKNERAVPPIHHA